MRSSFASRRTKAKKIIVGGDEAENEEEEPVVNVVKKKPTKPAKVPTTISEPVESDGTTDDSPAAGPSTRPITINRPKIKRTNLRLSFPSPSEPNDAPTEEEEEIPFVIKKSALSRKALERAAAARIGSRAIPLPNLPSSGNQTNQFTASTYSKEYLDELRSSTPTTPLAAVLKDGEEMDIDVLDETNEINKDDPLGTISKFGVSTSTYTSASGPSGTSSLIGSTTVTTTNIPDESLVKVLKARREERARKGKEQGSGGRSRAKDFISLGGSGDGNESEEGSSNSNDEEDDDAEENGYTNHLRLTKKKRESRLQRIDLFDDDDAELASYVQDDEKLILSTNRSSRRKALDEQRRRKQGAIQEALDFAAEEDGDIDRPMNDVGALPDDNPSDVSGDYSHHGWERDQLRAGAGLYALGSGGPTDLESRLRYQPPNIPPIPTLSDALSRLEGMLTDLELQRDATVKRVEGVRWEKAEIDKREGEVQEGLRKAGEEYARLGLAGLSMVEVTSGGGGGTDSGGSMTPITPTSVGAMAGVGGLLRLDRGLESIGNTPTRTPVVPR